MRVFISYASVDRATAEAIERALGQSGFDVWRDRTRLETDWSREIATALSHSDALCLLWTDGASESHWVTHEWLTARALEIPIVVVAAPQAPPNPAPLRTLDNVMLTGATDFARLIARFRQVDGVIARYDYTIIPPRSYLPFNPNPDFIGRKDALIDAYLGLIGNLQRIGTRHVGFTGLGGIGKTQLLVEVAYRFSFAFDGVYWIDGGDDQSWPDQLAVLAREYLDLARPDGSRLETLSECITALNRFAKDHPQFMLVVDNVTDPRELNSTEKLSHAHGLTLLTLGFSIIYSSRSRYAPPGVTSVDLGPLSDVAALALLTSGRAVHSADHAAATRIIHRLGNLPLALTLASAFLRKYPSVSLTDYADELGRDPLLTVDAAELTAEELATRHEAAVTATLRSQWGALSDEKARQVFVLTAQFAPASDIPKARIVLFAGPTERKSLIDRPWERAIALLEGLHLVEPTSSGESIRLHVLVRAYGQSLLSPSEQTRLRNSAARAAAAVYKDAPALVDEYERRGVAAVLGDLGYAHDWMQSGAEEAQWLFALKTVVARERHHLISGLNALQQLQFRAALLGLRSISDWLAAARDDRGDVTLHLRFASKLADQAVIRTYVNDRPDHFGGSTVRLTPSSRRAVTSNWQSLTVWDLDSGATTQLTGHDSYVVDIVTPTDDEAVSVDNEGAAIRWWLSDGRALERISLAECCPAEVINGLTLSCVCLDTHGRSAVMVWDNRETFGWDSPRAARKTAVLHCDMGRRRVRPLLTFEGHVNRCALSADGMWALVADNAEPIMVMLEIESGQIAQEFRGTIDSHYKGLGIGKVVFGRDGRSLATVVNEDVVLWDIATGCIRQVLRGHRGTVNALCYSDDGRLLISTGRDAVRTWDAETGQPGAIFRGHLGTPNGVVVVPGTTSVLTAGSEALVLWDLQALATNAEDGHFEAVAGLTATSDGRRVASAAGDGVIVWDRDNDFQPRRLTLPFDYAEYVDLNEEGRFTGSDVSLNVQYSCDQRAISFLADGNMLAIADDGGGAHVLDLATGEQSAMLRCCTSPIRAIAQVPDGGQLFAANYAHDVVLCDLAAGQVAKSYASDRDWLIVADLSRDGRAILTGGERGSICRFDINVGQISEYHKPVDRRRGLRDDVGTGMGVLVFPTIKGRSGTAVNCISQSVDGSVALIGRSHGELQLVNFDAGTVEVLSHGENAVTATALSDDGSLAVTGTSSGLICVWRCATQDLVGQLQTDAKVARMLLRGGQVFIGDSAGRLLVLELRYAIPG
jgi:WD40 repeat protein